MDPQAHDAAAPSALDRVRAFVTRHRKRLARAILLLFAAVVLLDLSQSLPTDTTVELDLGAAHDEAVELELSILDADEAIVRHVQRRYDDGAPRTLTETLDLTPGRYHLALDAERADGTRFALEGHFEAPAEGPIEVLLRPIP